MRLIGGQAAYYGSLHEAAEFWSGLVDVLLIKPSKIHDFYKGTRVSEDYVRRLKEVQNSYNLNILLHPEHRFNDFILEPSDPKVHKKLTRILLNMCSLVQENGFVPEVCLGPPAFQYPPYKIMGKNRIEEAEALQNSKKFFANLASALREKCPGIRISLETMHDPGRNKNEYGPYELLCYKPDHFKELICDNSDVLGICVDIGHVNLSKTPLRDYLKLRYEITSIHIHSNNGREDQHELPTRKNIKDKEAVEELFARTKGPLILELRNREKKEELKKVIKKLKEGKIF